MVLLILGHNETIRRPVAKLDKHRKPMKNIYSK